MGSNIKFPTSCFTPKIQNGKEISLKFNPYPEGTVKHISKAEYQKLNPEHRQFLELFEQRKQLEQQLKEVNEVIDRREKEYLELIDQGKTFSWCWKWIFKRTNISWKEICEQYLGKKKVQEIAAKIPATKYPHIGIEGYHPKPNKMRLNLKRRNTPPKFTDKALEEAYQTGLKGLPNKYSAGDLVLEWNRGFDRFKQRKENKS